MTTATRPRFSEHGYEGEIEIGIWVPPAAISRESCQQAIVTADDYRRYLRPATPEAIAARVAVLLAHFWVSDMTPGMQRAVADDWINVLGEFPITAIIAACENWLKSATRRPVPADIFARCAADVAAERHILQRLDAILERPTLG